MRLRLSRRSPSSETVGELVDERADGRESFVGNVLRDSADARKTCREARADNEIENIMDFLALTEAPEQQRHRTDVHRHDAEADEMRRDACEFGQHRADVLRARRCFDAQQLFDGENVADVVVHRLQIIEAVGMRDEFVVGFVLRDLLVSAVQVAQFRHGADDGLAVEAEKDAQHAVGGRMRRAHIEDHVVFERIIEGEVRIHIEQRLKKLRALFLRGQIVRENGSVEMIGHEFCFVAHLLTSLRQRQRARNTHQRIILAQRVILEFFRHVGSAADRCVPGR